MFAPLAPSVALTGNFITSPQSTSLPSISNLHSASLSFSGIAYLSWSSFFCSKHSSVLPFLPSGIFLNVDKLRHGRLDVRSKMVEHGRLQYEKMRSTIEEADIIVSHAIGDGWVRNHNFSRSRSRTTNCRRALLDGEGSTGRSNTNHEETIQETVNKSRKLLVLHKELLEQVAERKKIITTLSENWGNRKEQIKAFRESDITKSNALQEVEESIKFQDQNMQQGLPKQRPINLPNMSLGTVWPSQDTRSKLSPLSSEKRGSPPILFPAQTISSKPEEASAVDPAELPRDIISSPSYPSNFFNTPSLSDQSSTEPTKSLRAQDLSSKEVESKSSNKPPPLAGSNVMNVILVAAECAPWSKTGGLGDVAGALPKALARRGHRTMVVAPRYGIYEQAWDTSIRRIYNISGQDMEIGYFHAYIDGVDFVFIDSPVFHSWSNQIYGGSHADILTRMMLLCKAAIEVPWHVPCGGVCYGDGNLVFIANDWHTALLPVYLQAYYHEKGLMPFARSVLVLHNIAHQGRSPLAYFGRLGLPDDYVSKFRLYDPIGGEHMNILMAGLLTAHRLVAVSHGYASECQTQEGGWGLDNVIRENSWRLRGVVNGIDVKEWNPASDIFLNDDDYRNYTFDTLEVGKGACKAALQKELGLPVRADVPVLGFVGRLDHQKGVDIIAQAMPWLMDQNLQLVMLGSGRKDIEDMLRTWESQYSHKVRGWVGFSVKTAHRITAGADILLMPSRFEPCGLNQLYAMRYGTVPVVHAVGGLRDTVEQFNPFAEQGQGWTFDKAEASGLIHALGNAMWTFHDFKDSWRGIQKRGMSQDLSWDHAAQQYEEVLLAAKYQW